VKFLVSRCARPLGHMYVSPSTQIQSGQLPLHPQYVLCVLTSAMWHLLIPLPGLPQIATATPHLLQVLAQTLLIGIAFSIQLVCRTTCFSLPYLPFLFLTSLPNSHFVFPRADTVNSLMDSGSQDAYKSLMNKGLLLLLLLLSFIILIVKKYYLTAISIYISIINN
jgi:hypothetical protein